MAIDYQQILMDMNRPRRRPKSSGKTFAALCLLAGVAGGSYAVWHYGLVGKVWDQAAGLTSSLLGWDRQASSAAVTAPEGEADAADPLAQYASAQLRPLDSPPPAPVMAMAPPAKPVSLSANAVREPVQARQQPTAVQMPSAPAAPAPAVETGVMSLRPPGTSAPAASPATPVASVATPAAAPVQRTAPPAQTRPAASATPKAPAANQARSAASPNPPPVMSEAKMQIRAADKLLASDPAEAMRRMEALLKTRLQPDESAEAGYRIGYAARLLHDEEKAEKSWQATAQNWPDTRGGRYSALALADTWYQLYAGERPQIARWDDIQALYSQVLGQDDAPFLQDGIRTAIKANLTRINDSLFFGSAPTKLARYHKVEQGELLGTIGNKYRVDYESISRINGINPNRIRAGMDLKLIVGDISIVVRKNTANPALGPSVTWFLDGRWIREYPSCVGDGIKTPPGTYTLISKEREPSWTNPVNGQLLPNDHPENILGSRWMAMKGMNTQGLGIHGTTIDDSVPGYTSAGCVRLHNKDVEELFSFSRVGARVTVLD